MAMYMSVMVVMHMLRHYTPERHSFYEGMYPEGSHDGEQKFGAVVMVFVGVCMAMFYPMGKKVKHYLKHEAS
jgi:hypothetical protein